MKYLLLVTCFSLMIGSSMGQSFEMEKTAKFPGGLSKFLGYLSDNIYYPREARKKGISGDLYMEFFIKENGEIDKDSIRALSKDEVVKLVGESRASNVVYDKSLEIEAKRVLRNSPKWIPGSLHDVPTRQKMILPLKFGL